MYTCEESTNVYSWPDSLRRHVKAKHVKFVKGFDSSDLKSSGSLQLYDGRNHNFHHPFTMTLSGPTGIGKTYS